MSPPFIQNMRYFSTLVTAENGSCAPAHECSLQRKQNTGAQRAGSRWITPENAEEPPTPELRAGNTLKTRQQRKEV